MNFKINNNKEERYDDYGQISPNFHYNEFSCPCGCEPKQKVNRKLLENLERLRFLINKPIYITKGGGIRCKPYNDRVGGYISSPHLKGKAADIYIKPNTFYGLIDLAHKADKVGFTRIGLYPFSHFIHVDIIPPSPSNSWVRDVNGKYFYFTSLATAIEFANELT